jgi:glutamate dehydrogenase
VPLFGAVEALPDAVPATTQVRLLLAARELLVRGSRWFLAHGKRPLRIGEEVERFAPGVAQITASLDSLLAPAQAEELARATAAYAGEGVPADLARTLAGLPHLLSACDIVAVAEVGPDEQAAARLIAVARVHFAIADLLQLAWLGGAIARAPRRSGWDRLALAQLDDELAGSLRALTRRAVEAGTGGTEGGDTLSAVEAWAAASLRGLERYRALLGELKAAPEADLAMLSVAVRTLGELTRGR